ncbi:hypothetical protein ACFX13_015631 [Malus domestica]
MGETRCSTRRIFGEFSFRLTPGTTCSTFVEHKIITSSSPSSSSLFPSEGIFAPSQFCPVLSRPVPSRSVPFAYQTIPKGMGSLAESHNGQPNLVSNSPSTKFKPKTSHFKVKRNTIRL